MLLLHSPVIHSQLINKEMNHRGIYAIYNLQNEKFYIGSSNNVYKRFLSHFSKLRNNNHENSYLQRAYNKQAEYFIAFLIEKVEFENLLLEREQYWLDSLFACKHGYNLLPVAGRRLGFSHSEETKIKISNKTKGQKRSKEAIENMRVARIGKSRSEETKSKISESHIGLKHSEETKKKISVVQYVPVKQLNVDGEVIKIWDSMTTAQNEGGFNKANISKCCHGKRKTHKGFMWEFA